MNRKQIIVITVLGMLTLMLGCMSQPNHPSSHLEEKDIVGTYVEKDGANTWKWVFLDNRIVEFYTNGKKQNADLKWTLKGEIPRVFVQNENGDFTIFELNPDNSITHISTYYNRFVEIDGRKRKERKEESHRTYIKIK